MDGDDDMVEVAAVVSAAFDSAEEFE